MSAGHPGCEPGWGRGGTTHSGRHGLKAREEAEEDSGHQTGAALGAPCPPAQWVLPGWEVAECGLAAGHGHQGPLHCLGEGLTRVCAPCRVGGQRARPWEGTAWSPGTGRGRGRPRSGLCAFGRGRRGSSLCSHPSGPLTGVPVGDDGFAEAVAVDAVLNPVTTLPPVQGLAGVTLQHG